jgi:hypothetical protein
MWIQSSWSQPYVGQGYFHDGNVGKGLKSITFVPELAEPGIYEVRLSYVAHTNRATNTPITIHAVEEVKHLQVNQRETPSIKGLFTSLGTYELGPDSKVVVGNADTDGYVIVDAVQLIPDHVT